jgi:hypothetical protein
VTRPPLTETGLGDVMRVAAALDLDEAGLAMALELLGLRAPAERSAREPVVAPPVERPRPAPARRAAAKAAATPAEDPVGIDLTLPATVTTRAAPAPEAPRALATIEELLPRPEIDPPAHEGLFRSATRRALLRGVGSVRVRDGPLDVDLAVASVAEGRVLDGVPFEWIETTRGELQVLLDVGGATEPYRVDIDQLPGQLTRVLGADGIELRWFEDSPNGPAGVLAPEQLEPTRYELPIAGTRILAVTAFGVLGARPSPPDVVHRWRRFARDCRRVRIPLLVLTPLPPRRVPPIGAGTAVVQWDRGSGVREVTRAVRAAQVV